METPATAEAPTTETLTTLVGALDSAPTEEKEAVQKEDIKEPESISSKFAALEKKAAALRAKDLSQKQREQLDQQMRSRVAELEAEIEKERAYKKSAKQNPWDYLKAADLDYNYLTEFALNNSKPPIDAKIAQVEQNFEEKLQKLMKPFEEKLLAAEERENASALEAFRGQINSHVASNLEAYEMIELYKQHDAVFETINKYADETGKLLPIDEACKMVEDLLLEQQTADLPKLIKAKKLQHLLNQDTPKSQTVAPTPTLTNKISEAPSIAERSLSNSERLLEASRLIKFTT